MTKPVDDTRISELVNLSWELVTQQSAFSHVWTLHTWLQLTGLTATLLRQ